MKVLFVSSGNSINFDIVPFIKLQGESLREQGVELNYFPVMGKGIKGYIKSVMKLRTYLKENKVDLIHAHYSLCALTAILTFSNKPIIASFMGDDAYGAYNEKGKLILGSLYLVLLSKPIQAFVDYIIVKSSNIYKTIIFKKKCSIIPNGVNLTDPTMERKTFLNSKGIDLKDKLIFYLGNTTDSRKNFKLAKKAYDLLKMNNVRLIAPFPIKHEDVFNYLYFSDLLLFTSTMEGSPNLIKEAMACNCPIVATDVGDVRWILGNTNGCYITSFESEDVTEKIKLALSFGKRTNGRQRIVELGLDTETVAKKIVEVYKKVIIEK